MWGATGGGISNSNGTGALGGYSHGNANLSASSTLYVCVGGGGTYAGDTRANYDNSGGYNGGGKAGIKYDRDFAQGYGGGGCTHIAKVKGTLASIGLTSAKNNVYIVAGGGGGSDDIKTATTNEDHYGGIGGGSVGGDATYAEGSGGASSSSKSYTFGKGQDGLIGNDCGGGGGGWYGGLNLNTNVGGGGGSGYTNSTLLVSGSYGMTSGASNIPSKKYVSDIQVGLYPENTKITFSKKSWHGYARITLTRW